MAEELETVIVEFDDTGIGHLTLDRPDALNAINARLQADIVEGLELLERENEGADGVALRTVDGSGSSSSARSNAAVGTNGAGRGDALCLPGR